MAHSPETKAKAMTPKQERFVAEYLIDLNATQAAIRSGYSPKTADVQGYANLRKPQIAAAISAKREKLQAKTDITVERVLQEYARIAFFDPSRIFHVDEDGLPQIDMSAATEDDWRVVGEVTNTSTRIRSGDDSIQINKTGKIKLHCKLQALNQIGRHLGMFTDNVNHKVDLSGLSNEELEALERIQSKLTAKP